VARALPLTRAASLLQGMWIGDPWSAHASDIALLAGVFVVCVALTSRVFRWE
jgi:ABC-2 type transport system permease protein